MFNRLSGLVNSAVEVLAPQIVRRDEAFRVHWAHITAFYDRHFGAVTPTVAYAAIKGAENRVPVKFNIAYHLDLLVKYVKEEEAELGEETGPCLQYLLERRILDTLVEYATLDAPTGMRNHVLRVFAVFIVNVRARLLPEAAVRAPLQKLIRLCHHTLAAERKILDLEMTEDLVNLVHAVFQKLHGHPELMVLFFGRTAGHGDDAGQAHSKFYIFSVLLDYIMVSGKIGRIAREATTLTVEIAALPDTHRTVSEYLAYDSNLCETITERLATLYAMLPTRPTTPSSAKAENSPPESPVLRKGWGKRQSMASMGSDESLSSARSATAELTPSQKALFEFLSFFRFVDDVSAAGDECLTRRLSECFRTNFADLACEQVRAGCQDEQIEQFSKYMMQLINLCKSPALLRPLLSSLIGFDKEGWTRGETAGDDDASGLRKRLILNMAAPRESLSLTTLRLFDAILGSCDERVIEWLVMAPPEGKEASAPLSLPEVRRVVEKILPLFPAGDEVMTTLSVAPNGAAMKAGGFDEYLIEAQERHVYTLKRSAVVNGKGRPISTETADHQARTFESSRPSGSPSVDDDRALFLGTLLDELESMADASSIERTLLITGLLSRIVMLLDLGVSNIVYSKNARSKTIYGALMSVARKVSERSREVPDFPQKVRRMRAIGLSQASIGGGDRRERKNSADGAGSPGATPTTSFLPSSPTTPSNRHGHDQSQQDLAGVYVVVQEFCKELAANLFVKSVQGSRVFGGEELEADDEDDEAGTPPLDRGPAAAKVAGPPATPKSPGGGLGLRFLSRIRSSSSLSFSSRGSSPAASEHVSDVPMTLPP